MNFLYVYDLRPTSSNDLDLQYLHTFMKSISCLYLPRSSDGGNRSHNVSLPIILKKTKVGQILQYSCMSLLLVPILLYWIQVSVSLNVLLYFGAEMTTFCIKHIENRKIFF